MAGFGSVLVFLVVSLLSTLGSCQVTGDTTWDILNTTFPNFVGVPLTASEASTKGWEMVLQCGETDSPGNVYFYDNDLAAMPIYNADGNIAGIIIGIDDPGASQHGKAPWLQFNSSLKGISFYGIQGIFREPSTMCDSGSTGGVAYGDRLWIANGTHSDDYVKIPLNESYCALDNAGWDEGGCKDGVFRMGVHYWRYNSVSLDCDDAYPLFVLYDNHVLHAWGVAMGNYDRPYPNSSRWEHPEGSLLTGFFLTDEAPTCLANQSVLFNSMHVFMTSSVLAAITACEDETSTNNTADCKSRADSGSSETSGMASSTAVGESGSHSSSGDDKTVWIVVVVIATVILLVAIGGLAYWKCGKRKGSVKADTYNAF